jgi:hypothetical protein
MYKSMTVSGNKLKLVFSHAEGLRTAGNAKLTGMAIAGADNKWVWGDAVISQDTVIVSAASVAAPTKVRYGWGQFPPTNLYNAAGLPASPFQTDGPQLPVAMAKPPKAAAKAGHALEAPAGEACNVLGRKVDARTEGKVPAGNLLPPGR